MNGICQTVYMNHHQNVQKVSAVLTNVHGKLDEYFQLPDSVRTYHVSMDSWSIDEILEHITLTNHFLMLVIRASVVKALKRATHQVIPTEPSLLDAIDRVGDPDAFAWNRPEHMQPTGVANPQAIQQLLRQQFDECQRFLEALPNGEGSLHKVRMSVQNLGKLDVYQWLYFLAQHAQRHTVEIERLKQHYAARHR